MIRTKDCVKGWVDTMIHGHTNVKGRLVACSCQANGYYFMSYDTPIAKFCGNKFQLATKKYSHTTTKLQNIIRYVVPSDMLEEVPEILGDFPNRW